MTYRRPASDALPRRGDLVSYRGTIGTFRGDGSITTTRGKTVKLKPRQLARVRVLLTTTH